MILVAKSERAFFSSNSGCLVSNSSDSLAYTYEWQGRVEEETASIRAVWKVPLYYYH